MREKSIVKENILKYLENKGISEYAFYKKTGIARGVLKQSSGMTEHNIAIFLAHYTDVTPSWLFTDHGVAPDFNFVSEPSSVYLSKTDTLKLDPQLVPLYNIEATAGIVTLFSDMNKSTPIDYIKIPNLPKVDGAVYVTGDSMYPLLKSGDIVMYKEVKDIQNDIFYGEMYLISIEGLDLVTVKYIHKSKRGSKYIKLVSQNKHHADKDVELSKVKALGLIKASIRINSMS